MPLSTKFSRFTFARPPTPKNKVVVDPELSEATLLLGGRGKVELV